MNAEIILHKYSISNAYMTISMHMHNTQKYTKYECLHTTTRH